MGKKNDARRREREETAETMERKRRNEKAVVGTGKIGEIRKIDRNVANDGENEKEKMGVLGRTANVERARKGRQMERREKRNGKTRRWTCCAASILTIAASVPILTNVEANVVWGQISTATEERGAGSLLDSTQPNGRFSGRRYDGATRPTLNSKESRFSSGAVRGSAGNIVGVDSNRDGGRFSGASEFQSRQNFELFYWRNEIQKAKNAAKAAERALGAGAKNDGRPRPVVAKEAKTVSLAEARRGVRYGRTAEEIAAATRAEALAAAQNGVLPNSNADVGVGFEPGVSAGGEYDPATIWMRGRAPIADFAPSTFELATGIGRFGEGNWSAGSRNWVELDGVLRSEFAGASLAPSGAPIATLPELGPSSRSPEEKRRSYQEHLTTILLQTPEVNPLSPISVEYRDGVATVRGIVPTPSAREAAGRVLLAEPDVRRVENKLTFVRPDAVDGPGDLVPVLPPPGNGGNGTILPPSGSGGNGTVLPPSGNGGNGTVLPPISARPAPASKGLIPILPPPGSGGNGTVAPNAGNGGNASSLPPAPTRGLVPVLPPPGSGGNAPSLPTNNSF